MALELFMNNILGRTLIGVSAGLIIICFLLIGLNEIWNFNPKMKLIKNAKKV